METTTTLPERVQIHIARDVEKRMAAVSRFATADAAIAPLPLIAPFNRRNWLALAPDLRLATIRTNVTKQITARHMERHARRVAKAEAEAKAPAPAEEAHAPAVEVTPAPSPAPSSRYVVACVAGCGTFHPATSVRPVVVSCGQRGQTKPRGKRSLYGRFEGADGTAQLMARVREETAAALAEAAAPKRKGKGKAPKYRRRAICANSH